jgi:tetratricopeptide (TPR) repeat protein
MAEPDFSYDEQARELVQQGKIQEALDCYNEALKVNPENVVILNNKAIALITLDKCEEALVCTRRAVAINPDAVEVWINMGIAFDKLGRFHEAGDALERAVGLSPYNAYARAMLGIVYQKMDMGDCAEVQNRKLQEIIFPREYAGFYFTLSSFLLGSLLGGIRTVEGVTFEVSFVSQLIIIILFCVICWLYWRSRRMWQEINRYFVMAPQLPEKTESYPKSLYMVIIIMIIVFVIGIVLGADVRSYI